MRLYRCRFIGSVGVGGGGSVVDGVSAAAANSGPGASTAGSMDMQDGSIVGTAGT